MAAFVFCGGIMEAAIAHCSCAPYSAPGSPAPPHARRGRARVLTVIYMDRSSPVIQICRNAKYKCLHFSSAMKGQRIE
jgi:hypothetical protein